MNLSAIFAETKDVLLVDADPQGSAHWWTDPAAAKELGFNRESRRQTLLVWGKLKQLKDYNLVVVDTPPGSGF